MSLKTASIDLKITWGIAAYMLRHPLRAISSLFGHLDRGWHLNRTPDGQRAVAENFEIQRLLAWEKRVLSHAFEDIVWPRLNEEAKTLANKIESEFSDRSVLWRSAGILSDLLIRGHAFQVQSNIEDIKLQIDPKGDVLSDDKMCLSFEQAVTEVKHHFSTSKEHAENMVLWVWSTMKTTPRFLPDWNGSINGDGLLELEPCLEPPSTIEDHVNRQIDRWRMGCDGQTTPTCQISLE